MQRSSVQPGVWLLADVVLHPSRHLVQSRPRQCSIVPLRQDEGEGTPKDTKQRDGPLGCGRSPMVAVVQEEAERLQAIRALTSQRTRIASLAAENARQAREAGEEVSLKQLVVEVRLSQTVIILGLVCRSQCVATGLQWLGLL